MYWRVMMELRGADGSANTRGACWQLHSGRLLGGNLGPDTGASQAAAGRTTAPSHSGTDRGVLPQSAPLPAMWRATPAEGPPSPAAALIVRRCDGSCASLRPLPMQRGPSTDPVAGWRDHARSLHARV